MAETWMLGTGNQQYVESLQYEKQRQLLMQTITKAVQGVMLVAADREDPTLPLTMSGDQHSCEAILTLCAALESVLRHGLQGEEGKYRNTYSCGVWDLVSHVFRNGTTDQKKVIKTVEEAKNLHTADGYGRAWIRVVMSCSGESSASLVQTFSDLVENTSLLKSWYRKNSLMTTHEDTQRLVSLLSGLSFTSFQLDHDDPTLDSAPTVLSGGAFSAPKAVEVVKPIKKKKKRRKKKPSTASIEAPKKKGAQKKTADPSDPWAHIDRQKAPVQHIRPAASARKIVAREDAVIQRYIQRATGAADSSLHAPPLPTPPIAASSDSISPSSSYSSTSSASSFVQPSAEHKYFEAERSAEVGQGIGESGKVVVKPGLARMQSARAKRDAQMRAVQERSLKAQPEEQYEDTPAVSPLTIPATAYESEASRHEEYHGSDRSCTPGQPRATDSRSESMPAVHVPQEPNPFMDPAKLKTTSPAREDVAPNDQSVSPSRYSSGGDREISSSLAGAIASFSSPARARSDTSEPRSDEGAERLGISGEGELEVAAAENDCIQEEAPPSIHAVHDGTSSAEHDDSIGSSVGAPNIERSKELSPTTTSPSPSIPRVTPVPAKAAERSRPEEVVSPRGGSSEVEDKRYRRGSTKVLSSAEQERLLRISKMARGMDSEPGTIGSTPVKSNKLLDEISSNDDDDDIYAHAEALLHEKPSRTTNQESVGSDGNHDTLEDILSSAAFASPARGAVSEAVSLQYPDATAEPLSREEEVELERLLRDTEYVESFGDVTADSVGIELSRHFDQAVRVRGDRRCLFSASVTTEPAHERPEEIEARLARKATPNRDRTHSKTSAVKMDESISAMDVTNDEEVDVADTSDVSETSLPETKVYTKIHTKKSVKDQGDMCAGCEKVFKHGWVFGPAVRYCEYTGKYYCHDCHKNDTFLIPARVLLHWDLSHYYVCRSAFQQLREVYDKPILTAPARLCTLCPKLKKIKLYYLKDFLMSCKRKKADLLSAVPANRMHLVNEKDTYSLKDFVEVAKDDLLRFVRETVRVFMTHVRSCELCLARGSICEFCEDKKPIYPFDTKGTVLCRRCNACCHRRCYVKEKCPRCLRELGGGFVPPH